MDIKTMLQMQNAWKTFTQNHPKFPSFLKAAQREIREGAVLAFTVTTPEGKTIESNLKLTASDIQLIEMAMHMKK
ncbi:MAG: hypothetical protein HFI88_02660 [Lachnospiraceae bacterium]|nr:hypothetical protein [Lachnospiraceae bacterium]